MPRPLTLHQKMRSLPYRSETEAIRLISAAKQDSWRDETLRDQFIRDGLALFPRVAAIKNRDKVSGDAALHLLKEMQSIRFVFYRDEKEATLKSTLLGRIFDILPRIDDGYWKGSNFIEGISNFYDRSDPLRDEFFEKSFKILPKLVKKNRPRTTMSLIELMLKASRGDTGLRGKVVKAGIALLHPLATLCPELICDLIGKMYAVCSEQRNRISNSASYIIGDEDIELRKMITKSAIVLMSDMVKGLSGVDLLKNIAKFSGTPVEIFDNLVGSVKTLDGKQAELFISLRKPYGFPGLAVKQMATSRILCSVHNFAGTARELAARYPDTPSFCKPYVAFIETAKEAFRRPESHKPLAGAIRKRIAAWQKTQKAASFEEHVQVA